MTLPQPLTSEQGRDLSSSRPDPVANLLWVLVGVIAVSLVWFNSGFFGVQPALISGPSMNPTLYVGDVVIVKQVPIESINVGDLIHFRSNDSYIVHRVRQKEIVGDEIWFITQGDNNNVADPPVSPSQFDGKIILVVPRIGWITIWIRRLIGGG